MDNGLAKLDQLIARLEMLDNSMQDIVKNAIKQDANVVIDMNVSQLYDHGLNSDGVKIMEYTPYTEYTVRVKRILGQPTDRVTLRNTGDFHNEFYIKFGVDSFNIDSKNYLRDPLVSKYGIEIFGLTDENMSVVMNEIVAPYIQEKIKLIKEL